MNPLTIPFVAHLGLERNRDRSLQLQQRSELENHLGTMHAGALYTAAETQSGEALLTHFGHLAEGYIPILREGTIKYKRPVTEQVRMQAHIDEDQALQFEQQLLKKGRAVINIDVMLFESETKPAAVASFQWFVQKSEE